MLPADEVFADILRRKSAQVILAANKAEGRAGEAGYYDAFSLGLGDPVMLSAEHGEGLDDLMRVLEPMVEAHAAEAEEAVSPMEKEWKKRKMEDYSNASTQSWTQHFVVLEEFHYSGCGKEGHRLGFSKHCKQASKEPSLEHCATIQRTNFGHEQNAPTKMQICNCNCQSYLAKCK